MNSRMSFGAFVVVAGDGIGREIIMTTAFTLVVPEKAEFAIEAFGAELVLREWDGCLEGTLGATLEMEVKIATVDGQGRDGCAVLNGRKESNGRAGGNGRDGRDGRKDVKRARAHRRRRRMVRGKES